MAKVFCPRCDRKYDSVEEMETHLKKHDDFDFEDYQDADK